MKTWKQPMNWKMWIALLVCNIWTLVLMAQDNAGDGGGSSTTKSVDISVSKSENWYASPWVWVVGAAIFILLLVALLSGGRRSSSGDRVTVTRTVERDTDV